VAVLASGVLAASGCHKSPVVTTRTVTAYVPLACAADGGAYAEYYAYGDFEPTPPATGYFLSAVGTTLAGIDDEARALVVTASESASAWEGVGPVPGSGDVDVLLLPTLRSCALTTPVGPRTGSTMAPIGGEEVLIVGGTGNPTPPSYMARLDTGEVTSLGALDLQTPRTSASITACAAGALVAGGATDSGPVATAEVYSMAAGGFTGGAFPLSEPRAQHGAVVLATGETLLVGGVGSGGASDVLQSMDVVDPVGRASHEEGVGNLTTARRNPTVLALASGEILVGGGLDGTGAPVTSFEWFNADTTPASRTTTPLLPGTVSTMIALEAGGALVVAQTLASAPAGFQNAWVIDASGVLVPATPIPPPVASPVLFGGAGGAPVLWTGDRWLQWQPYAGAFGEIPVLDAAPAMVGDATCSPDPGLAMWLDPGDQQLTLLRFDTRNAYSSVENPLLVTGPDDLSPDGLGTVSWDIDTGLTVQPGSAAFVTDRTYADVDVAVTVATGPAAVELRDATGALLDVPGGCLPPVTPGPGQTLLVHRRGANVTWSLDATQGTCNPLPNGDARVSVGVRAEGTTPAVVMNMIVSRVGSP
jgi:hypothetical protein